MHSSVFFADTRARSYKDSNKSKVQRLFDQAGFSDIFSEGDLVAIKLHFGEEGNDTFVNPILVKPIVDRIYSLGAKPFLTDTNTLYGGSRANSPDHINTAAGHGFVTSIAGAPTIIADGLRGDYHKEVSINKKHFKSVKIAGEIESADCMIVISHFKAHLPAGFGGAIKNLGMGCASAAGKSEQHSAKPIFNKELCIGCKKCINNCPRSAITVEERISAINETECTGCGKCLRICPTHSIDFNWFVDVEPFMERIAEYAFGACAGKKNKIGFFNFLLNITPDCDCVPWSDSSLVPDIGILASKDPVAIDRASYDLVNGETGHANSMLRENHEPGKDKFCGTWPKTAGAVQIEYGESIGLGSKGYRLIKV